MIKNVYFNGIHIFSKCYGVVLHFIDFHMHLLHINK